MNAMGIGALGLLAAGAKLFTSASNVAIATSVGGAPQGEPPFLPLQAVQAAARQSGVGIAGRRSFASGPVIKWPVPLWEQGGGAKWSAGDLTQQFFNFTEAATAFKANLAVIRTADEMEQSLLDLRV